MEVAVEIWCSNQVLDSSYKGKPGHRFLSSNQMFCLSPMLILGRAFYVSSWPLKKNGIVSWGTRN